MTIDLPRPRGGTRARPRLEILSGGGRPPHPDARWRSSRPPLCASRRRRARLLEAHAPPWTARLGRARARRVIEAACDGAVPYTLPRAPRGDLPLVGRTSTWAPTAARSMCSRLDRRAAPVLSATSATSRRVADALPVIASLGRRVRADAPGTSFAGGCSPCAQLDQSSTDREHRAGRGREDLGRDGRAIAGGHAACRPCPSCRYAVHDQPARPGRRGDRGGAVAAEPPSGFMTMVSCAFSGRPPSRLVVVGNADVVSAWP